MKGVEVPPYEEDFTADPVELFFDLVFVFAFSRLVHHLIVHPDWPGIAEFVLLMMMIWLPWTQFTWSANAVAGNSRTVRILFLVATVASVPMAGSVEAALNDGGNGGIVFAGSLCVILVIALLTMLLMFDRDSPIYRSILAYSVPNVVAIVLMLIGGFLDPTPRVVLWVIALAIIIAGTIRAGSHDWVVRPGHFAERHGLIVIVALGEVIVALGIPVVDAFEDGGELELRTLFALIAAGAFACLLWWSIFDRPLRAFEWRHERHESMNERGRFARDVYTYAHLPIVAGIILAAAALEEITLHPKDELAEPFRWMLIAGLALNLFGVIAGVWRAFRVVAPERLVAIGVLALVVSLGGAMEGLTLLVIVDLVLLVMLLVEHQRVERRYGSTELPAEPATT